MDVVMKIILAFCLFLTGHSFRYEPGKSHKYSYKTVIRVNEPSARSKDVGLTLTCTVHLSPLWSSTSEQLIQLTLSDVKLQGLALTKHLVDYKQLSRYPAAFQWTDGQVGQFFAAEKDSNTVVSLKKGIVSLLQVKGQAGQFKEVDTSGDCEVKYQVEGLHITKTKQCRPLEIAGEYRNVNQVQSTSVTSSVQTDIDFKDDLIQSVVTAESHVASLNIRSSVGGQIKTNQELKYISSDPSKKATQGTSLETALDALNKEGNYGMYAMLLATSPDTQQCGGECVSATELVEKYREEALKSESLAKTSSAEAFLNLVDSFRDVGKNVLLDILKSEDNADVLPQLIDAAVATQTPASQEALMELINFEDDYYTQNSERYLFTVSFSTHPSEQLLKDLLELYKKDVPSETVRESIGLALGAVLNTYCRQTGQWGSQISKAIEEAITTKLAACEDEACKLRQLRALMNAHLPTTVPILTKYAEEAKETIVAMAALKALGKIDMQYITKEVQAVLARIYHQNNRVYDTTIRSAAVVILLKSHPSPAQLKVILLSLTDQSQYEMSTYVLAKLRDLMKNCPEFRSLVQDVLKDVRINNYQVIAQKGLSSAFSNFLAVTQDTNSTYGLYMENSKSGIMKSSSMDVDLITKHQILPILSFGLYTNHLESLAGDDGAAETTADTGEDEAEKEPTAGMSLDLMDVGLRPVEFFRGQGGLMSAVWNAPSEPISALQGNILAQDHVQRIHLQNGVVLELHVLGAVSIDLSGSISISLWNRNSHSVVYNSGAMVVKTSLQTSSVHLRTSLQYTTEASAVIEFTTDVNFYEMPFKMCLQMAQPPFTYSERITKTEGASIFPTMYESIYKKLRKMDGRSFILHSQNSKQCAVMDLEQ
ncbi:microsomal triglyceride transfer protein large subunit isoform X2 [Lingula anatina]|uniref:Microsomal triglyceride transfer protein large subunit isoform X2 n=1 Tax=Lingula anatina TaxID=7574 RepID=A0A1S3I547_LINAN|nr:microsomal triglyceride transfer protein large subunit isoform X2 [Lingula anatina]|eukprot:XP_013392489.1 microsomal triglyceride transfer protein large subunit isoform X2 [Lingula anatina]